MRLVALFEALAKSEEGVSLAELSATVAAPPADSLLASAQPAEPPPMMTKS